MTLPIKEKEREFIKCVPLGNGRRIFALPRVDIPPPEQIRVLYLGTFKFTLTFYIESIRRCAKYCKTYFIHIWAYKVIVVYLYTRWQFIMLNSDYTGALRVKKYNCVSFFTIDSMGSKLKFMNPNNLLQLNAQDRPKKCNIFTRTYVQPKWCAIYIYCRIKSANSYLPVVWLTRSIYYSLIFFITNKRGATGTYF